MIAPAPAKTSANVPISSAASARASGALHQQQPALAAAGIDREPLLLRRRRLHRLDDRAVHAVGDLVRELDADVLEAGRLEPGDRTRRVESAPAMQPTKLPRSARSLGREVDPRRRRR